MAHSGPLRVRGCPLVLFDHSPRRHPSPLSTMTDNAGNSSCPAPADRQHPWFLRPDFGPPARYVSEEEYKRGSRPCCEYCRRAQDVSPFYSICPASCPCPWVTRPGLEPGVSWRFNLEVQYYGRSEQRRSERRLCAVCKLVRALVIVQPVDFLPWCMCPWAVEEMLPSQLFEGTVVTELWYKRETRRAEQRRREPPRLVSQRQSPDAQGRCETLLVDENSGPPRPRWWWPYRNSTTLTRAAPRAFRHLL